jgi:hypothetical protein
MLCIDIPILYLYTPHFWHSRSCGDIFRSSESVQAEFKASTCKKHQGLTPFPNSEVDPPRKRDSQRL